ncbi:MAG: hypothetical protein WC501_04025 [Candidatus Micrarchaeia archaeon]
MIDVKKIKISKMKYRFDVNKTYSHTKKFNVIEKNPFEELVLGIRKKFSKKEEKITKSAKEGKKTNMLFFALIGLMILLGGIGLWIFATLSSINLIEPVLEQKNMEIRAIGGEILTYGSKIDGQYVGRIDLNQNIAGFDSVNLIITTYLEEPPYQVYILDGPREESQTETYEDFRSSLNEIFKKNGVNLVSISYDDLRTVSKGAIVIIPSGRIPEQMIVSGEGNINEILKRGASVLYIGQKFDNNGNYVDKYNQVKNIGALYAKNIKIEFEEKNLQSTLNDLYSPQYLAKGKGNEYVNTVIYDSLSVIKDKTGKGYLIIVPQTLDAGWRKCSLCAAADVATIVLQTKWLEETSSKEYNVTQNNDTVVRSYFTGPISQKNTYIRVDIFGFKNNIYTRKTVYLEADKNTNGELYVQDGVSILSSSISGNPIRVKTDLRENELSYIYPSLSIIQNGKEVEKKELTNIRVSTISESDFDVEIDVLGGEHTAQIIDENEIAYAKGYFNAEKLEISLVSVKENIFEFSFKINEQPKIIKKISVSVDNGKLGEYLYTDKSTVLIDLNPVLGLGQLSEGEHIFSFTVGETTQDYVYGAPRAETIFTSPVFFGTIILVFIILGIGSYLASQKKPEYYLDVCDFPPSDFVKVTVSEQFVIDIFIKENNYHKWNNVPLTLLEVSNGFKKTFYSGRHLYASDYNIGYILEKLVKKGVLMQDLDYYCPKEWTKEFSMRYLCIFRKIRDICVVNGIPFTKKTEAVACDSIITVLGQQFYLHIWEENKTAEMIKRILKNIASGMNIILVKNAYEKNKLLEIMKSPSQALSLIKMENETKTIETITLDEFEKMIKEMKS